jgi:peptide/nickel transport system permease protein
MWSFIFRRLLLLIPVLFLVSLVSFGLIFVLPGDPAMAMLGPDQVENKQLYLTLRAQLGLDRPLPVQYLNWLVQVLHGNLGTSIRTNFPVTQLLLQSLGPTVQLAVLAMIIALVIAVPVGIISAVRPGSWADVFTTIGALAGVAIPDFWLGIMLIFVFSLTLRLLPPSGYVSPAKNWGQSFELMILPSFTLGTALAAVITRQIRSAMLETLQQDYVLTARAKGLRERLVVIRHAFRNALIPVLTVIGLQIGHLMGGVVIAETIFAIPGMGRLAVDSISFRDFPVVQGVVLVMAVAVLLANFVTDLLYALVDPRIRYS